MLKNSAHTISVFIASAVSASSTVCSAQALVATETLPTVTIRGASTKDDARHPNLATGVLARALDIPFSVTRVNSDIVREQSGTTLQEALHNVPGAQADSGFNGSHTQVFILRGAATDSGTGSNRVLRDGVRLSNYPYVPAFVESVDVLRGPGAAASVRSEPGGTVNITTRQPKSWDFGSIFTRAGSSGAKEISVDLNRVLSTDGQLVARMTATHSRASEWRGVPDRLEGVKLGVSKSGGDRYQLRIGFEATNQNYRPDYGVPALDGRAVQVPRDRQLSEPFGDSSTNNRIADIHAEAHVGGGGRVAVDLTHVQATSTAIKNSLVGLPLADHPAGTFARMSSWEPDTRRSNDAMAISLTSPKSAGAATHQFYLGIDFYKENLHQPLFLLPPSSSRSINVYAPRYGAVVVPENRELLKQTVITEHLSHVGATVQQTADFGNWSLVNGIRFSWQKFLYGSVGVLPEIESRWSPKFAVLHRLTPSSTIYANVATGTSPNQVLSSSNQSLPSRRSTQYEVGWKSQWYRRKVTSEVAIFTLDQQQLISSDLTTPNNDYDFTTAGSGRSRGLEASLSADVAERFNATATYAYTASRYGHNSLYGGMQVPNVARHALNFWGRYHWNEKWKSGFALLVQSRRFADATNTTVLPGYVRADLVQSYEYPMGAGQSCQVQLALRNLADTNYLVSSHLHVSRWITPAQGRNVSFSIHYRF